MNMNPLTVDTPDAFATMLELAANNDIDGFTQQINRDPSSIDEVGLWYGRQKRSKQMVLEHLTPLMVASIYGSIDVLKSILSLSTVDVNTSSGVDKTTALHCAASGGSSNAADVVKLLLVAGADPGSIDVNGLRPADVIVASPKSPGMKTALRELLGVFDEDEASGSNVDLGFCSPPRSQSPENGFFKKEYPVDPSLPDIKNGIYSTDEFRIFSFKVRPCSRAYSHDWTECPFVHPGENARRRDPRKYHYSCVPCPDFRKAACRRGDTCEYAHGVFESWLHPAQYRTRLCKDGTGCNRRVCFFAHTQDELRPLYVSTGSPAAAMNLIPGSPQSFTPPISPSGNGMSNWPQPNIPSLHLPGSNPQSGRLRSSLYPRDFPSDQDLSLHLLNELSRDSLSPRFSDQSAFSPRNGSSVFNQFHQQQSMLSPINTNAPFAVQSPGRMSPRTVEPISPMSSRVSMLARENQPQQRFRSLSSRELGSSPGANVNPGSPVESWSKWGSSSGKADWAVNADEFGKRQRSANGGMEVEADVSWVRSLVKEPPHVVTEKLADYGGSAAVDGGFGGSDSDAQIEGRDQSALSAWIEQMQLDQLVAQQN